MTDESGTSKLKPAAGEVPGTRGKNTQPHSGQFRAYHVYDTERNEGYLFWRPLG